MCPIMKVDQESGKPRRKGKMEQYENYLKAERALSSAKEWNDLPNGPKYQNDKMDISMAHCSLKLQRAGQQFQGGQNYWDAPPELTAEIIKLIAEDKSIIERALDRLEKRAAELLVSCEEETVNRLEKIVKTKQKYNL